MKSKENKPTKKSKRITDDPFIKKVFGESEVMVMLEKMDDRIDIIAEGHKMLDEKMDRNFEDMRSSFKTVFEYLSRVEDELMELKNELKNNYEKKGWDKEWRDMIEKRLSKLEKSAEANKVSIGIIRDKGKKYK